MGKVESEERESSPAAASTGDAAAVRALYEKLAPRVAGYLRLRGAEDPDSLTNEVFVKVLPKLAEVTGGYAGIRALAFSVAHGLLVDELRRAGRRPALVAYDPGRDVRTQPSAEELTLAGEGHGGALDLLWLLPEDQRSVILLRVLGELSTAETAEAMGRSPGSVKKMQAKALATLRALADEVQYQRTDPGTGSGSAVVW